MDTDLS